MIPGPVPLDWVDAIVESRVTLDSMSYTVCRGEDGLGSTSKGSQSDQHHIILESQVHPQSLSSTPRRGKLTMVGFFSSTKLFLVNRLMCNIRYGGRAVRWCRLSVGPNSLRGTVSFPFGISNDF